MELVPFGIHVMEHRQIHMQCNGDINQHEGDIFIPLDLEDSIGQIASSQLYQIDKHDYLWRYSHQTVA